MTRVFNYIVKWKCPKLTKGYILFSLECKVRWIGPGNSYSNEGIRVTNTFQNSWWGHKSSFLCFMGGDVIIACLLLIFLLEWKKKKPWWFLSQCEPKPLDVLTKWASWHKTRATNAKRKLEIWPPWQRNKFIFTSTFISFLKGILVCPRAHWICVTLCLSSITTPAFAAMISFSHGNMHSHSGLPTTVTYIKSARRNQEV